MTIDNDYESKPNEPVWDHAHRIVMTKLVLTIASVGTKGDEIGKIISQPIGAYLSGFKQMKNSLLDLYRLQERLQMKLEWTRKSSGEWVSQLITVSNDNIINIIYDTKLAFMVYVKSWQPLMDAIAELIYRFLKWRGFLIINRNVSMTQLVKAVANKDWPTELLQLKSALTTRIKWYMDDIRIMRNQFIHNQREVTLISVPESKQIVVELEKLDHPETKDKFFLDQFVNWTLGNYLLFAVAAARGLKDAIPS